MEQRNKKWYEKIWLVIVLCIIFFPVGLIFLWINSFIKLSWKIIITILFGVLLIIGFTQDDSNDSTVLEQVKENTKAWNDYTYEEKETWINNYLKNPDDKGYEMVVTMQNAIKKQFNNPNSVGFNAKTPLILEKGYVAEADSGWVFIGGGGYAKNGFGEEKNFSYSVKLRILPDNINLLEAKVNEFE